MTHRILKIVISVAVVCALLIAGVSLVVRMRNADHAVKPSVLLGPMFKATVDILGGPNNTVSSVSSSGNRFLRLSGSLDDLQADLVVLSPVPTSLSSANSANLVGVNQTSNGYEEILFQGVANSTGVFSGRLSSSFYNIDKMWRSFLSEGNSTVNQSVSLTMYGELQYLNTNGSLEVYQYYNNIPFNPFDSLFQSSQSTMLSTFNVNLYFNLAMSPNFILPPNATGVTPQSIGGGGGCSPETCHDTTSTVYTETVSNVWMPLAMANLTSANENSGFNLGVAVINTNLELSFNSNSGSATNSGTVGQVQMSQNPSYSNTYNSYYGGTLTVQPSLANENTSAVYALVTEHVVRTETQYYACSGSTCVYHGVSYSTSISVTDAGSYATYTNYFYNLKNSPFWGDILGAMGHTSIYQQTLSPGQNNVQVNVGDQATGYSSASGAEAQAVDAASTFVGTVGLAMAIATATSDVPLVGTAADAVNDINVALAAAGLSLAILSAFESISYSTNVKLTTTVLISTNQPLPGTSGTDLAAYFFQSSALTTLTTSQGTFSPNMPQMLVNVVPQ